MPLVYNSITLQVLNIREYTRRPVYHFANYLYTRHTLKVRAVFNPRATSFRFAPGAAAGLNMVGDPPLPGVTAGMWTDAALRHRLMQRRRQLIYTQDSVIPPDISVAPILISPQRLPAVTGVPGPAPPLPLFPFDPTLYYTTDASTGPIPLEFRIHKRHADKTLEIDWAIQTDVNECNTFTSKAPFVMLSNVYKMTRVTDQDHFSTRTVEGEAVFRMDELLRTGGKADDFVSYLSFPVPQNMQRVNVQTFPSEDGTRCAYRFQDVEKPFNIAPLAKSLNVTRIEASHTFGVGWGGVEAGVRTLANAGRDIARNAVNYSLFAAEVATGSALAGLVGPEFAGAIGAIGTAALVGGYIIDLADALLPTFSRQVTVRVWGNRNAVRKDLLVVAVAMLVRLLSAEQITVGQTELQVSEDLVGNFIELHCKFKMGPIGSTVQLVTGQAAANQRSTGLSNMVGGAFMLDPETIPGVLSLNPSDANPAPPLSRGARGTFVGALVSAALMNPCDCVPMPTDPPPFTDTIFSCTPSTPSPSPYYPIPPGPVPPPDSPGYHSPPLGPFQ